MSVFLPYLSTELSSQHRNNVDTSDSTLRDDSSLQDTSLLSVSSSALTTAQHVPSSHATSSVGSKALRDTSHQSLKALKGKHLVGHANVDRRALARFLGLTAGGTLAAGATGWPLLSAFKLAHALEQEPREARSIQILTTTNLLAEPLRNLLPRNVVIDSIMTNGVDPHLYVPVRTDIERIVRADIVIHHGLGFEANFGTMLSDINKVKPVINACAPFENQAFAFDGGIFDPHMWLDPILWRDVIFSLYDRIVTLVPSVASPPEILSERTAAWDRLVAYAQNTFQTMSPYQRILVTSHESFAYFARRFEFQHFGIQGVSTVGDVGIKRLRQVAGIVLEQGIPVVFPEVSVSPRLLYKLVEISGARGRSIRFGTPLFTDSLGVPPAYESTYFGVMDHNITAIALALGGRAPQKGMSNSLSLSLGSSL